MAASMILKGCRRCLASRLTKEFLSVVSIGEQRCGYQIKSQKKAKGAQLDPADVRSEDKIWLAKKPFDRIYFSKDFPPPKHTFEKAVQMHKDLADVTMMNNLENLLYANMDLNMSTKKKTKFMKAFSGLVSVPHPFDDKMRRNVAVFCKEEAEMQEATAAGAKFVGEKNLINMIISREIPREDIDYLICTPDMLSSMSDLRVEFRDNLPSKRAGTVGTEIEEMVKFHITAVSFKVRKISDADGRIQIPIGPMTLTNEELMENFTAIVNHLADKRSITLGPFIKRIELIAPPSTERHLVTPSPYVPGYVEEEPEEEVKEEEEEEQEVKAEAADSDSDDESVTKKKKN